MFVSPKVELIMVELTVKKICHASLINRKVLPVAVTHYPNYLSLNNLVTKPP